MSNIMIILHTKDYLDLDGTSCEVFIDRKYIGALEGDTYVLNKILTAINADVVKEEVNLDSYLDEEERFIFSMVQNFFFTETEQDAILAGQIDYAFDMIKNRLVKE